jgi:hypothetical protein
MSTTAILTFKDEEETYSIYQQYDGDPKEVAKSLNAALEFAWELPRFEASEFAAAYVRANKVREGGIYLSLPEDYEDIAYKYVVTLEAEQIRVHVTKGENIFSSGYALKDLSSFGY